MATSRDTMPSHYETQQTTSTTTSCLDRSYLTTKESILKIAEMVIAFCLFITGLVGGWLVGMAMLSFTGITSLITVASLLLFRLCTHHRLYNKTPGQGRILWTLIEFVHYVIMDVFYLICAIITSACVVAVGVCGPGAFFSWVGLLVFAADTFFTFQRWRSGAAPCPEVQNMTIVTSTETTAHH